ncbi:YhdH/YhfP family quinone oxidoreductase [Arsenicibacter rosenii]|uniref:Oxidoreductase n=1 Tax=Arsenicibacter rosenii TaxID=1750698 RepID=A0A1S2VP13_9BACT|nr:YhdH/YhfP family quinone oxidoreductase [Arsenicibacter rosenii]OIN60511.1 oxidoreductase [Arsenicibacter rosenii]
MEKDFDCLLITEVERGKYETTLTTRNTSQLPQGDVLIRVHYSSLNFKDALSASGNRGVTRHYPHTPGVDAAGIIERSNHPGWRSGEAVIVTGFDLGMNTSGGLSQYIRVPAQWLVRRPENLTLAESMMYGTAGFTAALSVAALQRNGVTPDKGPVVVTGSTGGVGSIAIAMLAKQGYPVVAVSGKTSATPFLKRLGATEVIPRSELEEASGKALLKTRFAGAVDTVGGVMLANVIKSTNYGGTVTCCGMVSGGDLPITVFPFILRGIQLVGIDSVEFPLAERAAIWERMATDLKPADLPSLCHEIGLEAVPDSLQKILQGGMQGRALVRIDQG